MAMIECSECHSEISSNAPACPKCGNPQGIAPAQTPDSIEKPSKGVGFLSSLFVVGAGVLVFFLFGVLASNRPSPEATANTEAEEKAAKAECVKALMTIDGHSTVGYADKQAYDAYVASKCKGFDIPK